jgi:hypothetical protein
LTVSVILNAFAEGNDLLIHNFVERSGEYPGRSGKAARAAHLVLKLGPE